MTAICTLLVGSCLALGTASSGGEASEALPIHAEVKVADKVLVVLSGPQGDLSATERARLANQDIAALLDAPDTLGAVHLDESTTGLAVVYAGKTPVLTLSAADATAAGQPSLQVLAADVALRLGDELHSEKRRSQIATTVFSLSLVVLIGLMAFLLLGGVNGVASRLQEVQATNPAHLSSLRVGKIEVLSAAAVRSTVAIGLLVVHRLAQFRIIYGSLLFSLSLFDATRPWTERLTGLVLSPLSSLVSRVSGALPVLVIVLIASTVVFIFIRFIRLFFEGVARGETRIAWLPSDFAQPISLLLRPAVVVAALLVATPLTSGSDEGAFARAGLAALFAIGLAITPVLASLAAGSLVVFRRRLRIGDWVELGPRTGLVLAVSLLEVRLLDRVGTEVRVPHLMGLFQPTRVIGKFPLSTIDLTVGGAHRAEVRPALDDIVGTTGGRGRIELLSLTDTHASYRITGEEQSPGSLERAVRSALINVERLAGGPT